MKITNNKKMMTVKVSDLKSAPWNPRKTFDEKVVSDIAADLKDGKPLIQAPSVWENKDGGYYIIAGNTRMEAVRRAGLTMVDVIVWDVSEEEAMAMTFKENEQRSDVYPVQQAMLIGKIFAAGKDVEDIVASTGLKKSSVYDYLSISRRVRPDILAIAEKHPDAFDKSLLLELAGYTLDAQKPLAEEWASDVKEDKEWRPDTWIIRARSHSLKGCKFAGKGSKCATCSLNSANIGRLPGFEEESGENSNAQCLNHECWNASLEEWKKAYEAKKLSKYAEKVHVQYQWYAVDAGATQKKPDADNPCCYWWWDNDRLEMMFGPSQAAKKAAEKAAKAAERDRRAQERIDEEVAAGLVKEILDANQITDGYEDKDYASFLTLLVKYFAALAKDSGEGHAFLNYIGRSITTELHYDHDPKIIADIYSVLGLKMTDEETAAIKRLSEK